MDQKQSEEREQIKEMGSLDLGTNKQKDRIKLLTIIGEIEGHEAVSGNTKATKYEHLLPVLAEIEDSEEIDGLLVLLHTLGGDVEAGLSIAEMIASLSKPTVSACSWRQPFYRRTACSISQIFFYCSKRHDGCSSGAYERHVYRRGTEPSQYAENTGSDHPIPFRSFENESGEN